MNGTMLNGYLHFGSTIKVVFVGFVRNHLTWNSFRKEFESSGVDPFNILEVFNKLYGK